MQSLLLPHLVDDVEHSRMQPGILDPELLGETAPVHEIVAGLLAAALLAKRDLRVGKLRLERTELREIVSNDVWVVRVSRQKVLMIVLGRIKPLERHDGRRDAGRLE